MKKLLLFSVFSLSTGIFAQNTILNSYQQKTMKTERFARPVNTGINHTLLILGSAWETSPEIGDEIAVYDSERNLVSSVAWRPEQEGHSGMAIWGDDETTSEKEGMLNGETFSIVLFDKSEDLITELEVNGWEKGNNVFSKDGISVISSISTSTVIEQELELYQNVPNPVMDNTSISFYLPEDSDVRLTVSNTIGQEIMTLASDNYTKGMHTIQMDANTMSTGVYFYKLESNNKSITKQLTLVK